MQQFLYFFPPLQGHGSFLSGAAGDAQSGKPFFLYFALTSPHLHHCTHPDFHGRSNCGNYGDFVEETDYRVGQVLDVLQANGLENTTLVIFTSDNGAESNYEYQRDTYQHYSCMNFKGGKRDIYEGGLSFVRLLNCLLLFSSQEWSGKHFYGKRTAKGKAFC